MSKHTEQGHQSHGGSMKSYVIGFVLSIIFTIIPLVIVMNSMLNKSTTLAIILGMAILQFVVQLVFFMHIRDEEKPRYNVIALIFGLCILVTIVAGSIWIMTYNTVA
ncbi:Cytochrome bo(3) ubiquinol oxidase subunit 4 [compost metagenome]